MWWQWWLGLVLMTQACSLGTSRPAIEPMRGATQVGVASWYGPGFHGKTTSSGEVYDQFDLTAAHRTLPLGTRVAVTHLDSGRTVEVRINDRGPFVGDRIVDLSYAAARQLELIGPGTARVRLEVLGIAPDAGFPSVSYAVQVGSFSDSANAERLRRRLEAEFGEARVTTLETDSGRYFRVRLARHGDRDDAVDQARQAASLGLPAVVVEE